MNRIIKLSIFLFMFSILPSHSSFSAPDKQNPSPNAGEEYGAFFTTIGLHFLRAFIDVKFGAVNYDTDLSIGSVSDLKLKTSVGNFEFGEILVSSIGSSLLKPSNLDGRIVTGGQIEISNFKFSPMEEKLSSGVVSQARDLGFSEINGDCLIHYEYDWGNSGLKLSTVLRLSNGGEIHVTTEIQDIALHLSTEIFNLTKSSKPPVPMDSVGRQASAKIKFMRVTFYDDGLVKKGIELYAVSHSMSPKQAERAIMGQIDVFSSPFKKTLPPNFQTKINKLVLEDLPAFMKSPDSITLSFTPKGPVSFQDLETLVARNELETLNFSVLVNKKRPGSSGPRTTAKGNKVVTVMNLMSGTGTPQNFSLAARLIGRNPDLKNPELLFYLAKLHSSFADGVSRQRDLPKAYQFAILSSAGGYRGAARFIKIIERQMGTKDIRRTQQQTFSLWKTSLQPEAFKITRKKALLGRIPSIRKLARGFWYGRNMPRNFLRAYAWANIGAARGDIIMRALRDRMLSVVGGSRFLSAQDLQKAQDLSSRIWQEMVKN